MPDIVVVTESGIVTVAQGETLVTVYDGRGLKGDPGDTFDQTLNTTDAVEFAGLINNGLTFPTADGTAGQVIETDGAGVLSFVTPSGGDYLPLAGGTMTGNIVFDGTSGQFIGKGTFDTSRGGNYGLSIVCSVGYEFNWQAGWLITTEQSSTAPRPLYLDSLAGTTLRAWNSSTSTGTEVDHLGITFPDATVQTTAYTGGAGVSSLTAGTGISLDVTTGDVTITNSEPDQTVTLADGAGITITGTYPSFTVDCDITQYADTDARLALSAGTGISYDNATGIITNSLPDQTVSLTQGTDITITGTYPSFTIAYSGTSSGVSSITAGAGISIDVSTGDVTVTNDAPDQTVTLTNGTGITITGTYPSFTIDCDITQYTETDARLALSAGTGISYDNATGIITNSNPDQTVLLTDGTGITVTGTYPSFTITNSLPDQTVSLTDGTDISVTGTYPNFTISYTGTGGSGTVTSVDMSVPTGLLVSGNPITTTGTLAVTFDTGYSIPTNASQGNWDTAYSNHLQWDGGATGLTASTGRSSLGATTVGENLFTLVNPSAVTFPRFNADNTVTALTDANFRTAIGAGTSSTTGTVTSISTTSPITGGTITGTGTIGINAASANTASFVVQRDASGNFSAGTITASLIGNASTVTTNANLTGVITSVGNTTSIASQTGTGSKFVVDTSPVITTPTITGLNETKTAPAISAGVLALNCASGNVFAVSLNAAITSITFSNIPASNTAYGLTLAFTADGTSRSVTWGSAIKWSGGTAPTLTSTLNKVDIFVLTTWDGGTTWYAMVGGQNF